MNKYRGMTIPESMTTQARAMEKTSGRLLGGIVLNASAQNISSSQSPDSEAVFIEQGGIRQDYSSTILGASVSNKVLALGEHRFVLSGSTIFERIFRIERPDDTFIKIESWDGAAWSSIFDSNILPIADVLLSWVSLFNKLWIADGNNALVWEPEGALSARDDNFGSSNALTVVNHTTPATISPAIAYDQTYTIHYSVAIGGPCAAGSFIEISVLDDDSTEIGFTTLQIPASTDSARSETYPHESLSVEAYIPNLDVLTLKFKTKTIVGATRVNTLASGGSGTPLWLGTKTPSAESQTDDYIFTFSLEGDGVSDIAFYYDLGGGSWVLDDTLSYPAGVDQFYGMSINGMGAGARFGIHVASGSLSIVSPSYVTWEELHDSLTVSIHGFDDPASDPSAGVTYSTAGAAVDLVKEINKDPDAVSIVTGTATTPFTTNQVTAAAGPFSGSVLAGHWIEITAGTAIGQIREITARPASTQVTVDYAFITALDGTSTFKVYAPDLLVARYFWSLAGRPVALQVDDDLQKIAWSTLVDVDDWVGDGSGETILSGIGDPIDALMALPKLTSEVGTLIRERSIMRAVPTGSLEPAIGFYRWIDGLGTNSPFSPAEVIGGVLFLGHDFMVYFLSESGALPVGQAIQEELRLTLGSNPEVVEGVYDAYSGTYILAVPSGGSSTQVSWIFDFGRFLEYREVVWQRHSRQMNRAVSVKGGDIYFATADGNVLKVDRTTIASDPYWTSGTLPIKDQDLYDPSKFSEHTLGRVSIRYRSPDGASTIQLEGSGDGGVTWAASNNTYTTITQTYGNETQRARAAFDNTKITGHDLRFRIKFPSDTKVIVLSWEAEVIQHGGLDSE